MEKEIIMMERVKFEQQERLVKQLERIAGALENIANAWGKNTSDNQLKDK